MFSDSKEPLDLNLDEKRAQLAERLRRKTRAPKSFPASFSQHRLWFLDQLAPGNSIYNIPVAMRLRGQFDVEAMRRALSQIIRRHQSLRTVFSQVEGQLQQVVAPAEELALPVTDISHLPGGQREVEMLRLATEEAHRPFDLSTGPLFRASLLRLGEEEHILLLTMHHIISDGWSAGVLIKETGALYEAFSAGKPSTLPPLPIQYADYAAWQRKRLQGEGLEKLLDYWRGQLAGAPPMLDLPTDQPRPPVQSFRGSSYSFHLSPEIAKAARDLSQREGTTMFMTLLAAFQALMSRYSGQDDIVVGTPIANRNHVDTEGLIGFFVNTLVLRGKFSGDPTFLEFLQQLRATALEAYAHQEMPFEELVKDLQPERNLSYSPLFQVMFALQNVTRRTLKLSGLELESVKTQNTTAKFELVMEIEEVEEGLRASLQYDTDLFERETVERMAGHYRTLLENALARPGLHISELPMLTEGERRQLLGAWGGAEREHPAFETAASHFEAQAARSPQAVAVVSGQESLTYEALNRRADQLSAYLRRLGSREGSRVALLAEPSAETLVGLLGILKAGAACVPVEPQSPPEHLTFILQDAGVEIFLTRGGHLTAQAAAMRVVRLDEEWESIANESLESRTARGSLDDLVSVLYRLGPKGQLTGVMIEGRGVLNACLWDQRFSRVDAQTRVLTGLSFSSDGAIQHVLTPLITGGQLVLAETGDDAPAGLLNKIAEQKVTALSLSPTQAYALADLAAADDYRGLSSVECLTLVGEPLTPSKLRGWLKSENCRCRLVSVYALTECSGAVSAYSAGRDELALLDESPVGRPIDNARLYVLDKRRALLPVGVAGELCVSGDLLARGYLNRPELTAQRFVSHPFAAGERMFLTGERARFRSDGRLEVLGRVDPRQVRIRGVLIDLGEIEEVLNAHEHIREATVLMREDAPGAQRLVAYVEPLDEDEEPTSSELHRHVRANLPAFMVPSVFVTLDELPRGYDGKVDRRALPAPELLTSELLESFVAPRDAVEEGVAKIWSDVLNVERVGVNDNFFSLGGHSLLATQVMSRLREDFGVNLPLRQLFETPTVAGLSLAVTAARASDDDDGGKIERVTLDEDEQLLERLDNLSDEDLTALLMEDAAGEAR